MIKNFKYRGVKCHIVNQFVDNVLQMVVYKYWSKTKQRWIYECDYKDIILLRIQLETSCK